MCGPLADEGGGADVVAAGGVEGSAGPHHQPGGQQKPDPAETENFSALQLTVVIPGPTGAAVDHHHQGIEHIAAGEEKAAQQRHRPDRLHSVHK